MITVIILNHNRANWTLIPLLFLKTALMCRVERCSAHSPPRMARQMRLLHVFVGWSNFKFHIALKQGQKSLKYVVYFMFITLWNMLYENDTEFLWIRSFLSQTIKSYQFYSCLVKFQFDVSTIILWKKKIVFCSFKCLQCNATSSIFMTSRLKWMVLLSNYMYIIQFRFLTNFWTLNIVARKSQ